MCFILPGKTLFIIYVLVVRLGQRRAVALQLSDYYALFEESVSFHTLSDEKPLANIHSLWAFTDSNAHTLVPGEIFLGEPDRIRPIQTTAPEANRWKEWSKHSGAVGYIMDIWSEKETGDLT